MHIVGADLSGKPSVYVTIWHDLKRGRGEELAEAFAHDDPSFAEISEAFEAGLETAVCGYSMYFLNSGVVEFTRAGGVVFCTARLISHADAGLGMFSRTIAEVSTTCGFD